MIYDIIYTLLWLVARTGCLFLGHDWQPLSHKRLCDICRRCGKFHAHFRK